MSILINMQSGCALSSDIHLVNHLELQLCDTSLMEKWLKKKNKYMYMHAAQIMLDDHFHHLASLQSTLLYKNGGFQLIDDAGDSFMIIINPCET